MEDYSDRTSLAATLRQRRQRLSKLIDFPVILWSGQWIPRNFAANPFPFRASSHFLYFAGLPLENAAIRLQGTSLELFMDEAAASSKLWHGETATREDIAKKIGADAVFNLCELQSHSDSAATVAVQDVATHWQQTKILNRPVAPANAPTGIDLDLAKAITSVRLCHDASALLELQKAAAVTIKAHQAGMGVTKSRGLAEQPLSEAVVRSAMESVIIAHNMSCAYGSIVTVHGEVLHNHQYQHPLQAGDLLLADVGADTEMGWAADITRTWPVSGKFSPTQRDLYDIVLAAHDACIEQVRPGVEYLDIHLLAATVIAQGLVDLGILRGKASDLVERDAHALFFPHGVGHLLGLDVHDLEDLGDLSGYQQGRVRSSRFGLSFLRLHRPLQTGMLVTIEPGFYQVRAILQEPKLRSKYQDVVNWERLNQFADVRGIRIEDDVLVTQTGNEVLTAALPTKATVIEHLVNSP
ncbi:MAG: aminopeptidase P family protein [Symploca sp. SIO1C4]|uniref:Xaa-Pro aminopeptidase n=1 Tax=Symploca sp. SIO1C4 TaxID=2607765 RepID=A0A6B3NE53_9CYAN|nr:aminopeptidase P family protein [Symploca sp. SIO1C4]